MIHNLHIFLLCAFHVNSITYSRKKVPLPEVDDPAVIPPPYVVRMLLLYGRSYCVPTLQKSEVIIHHLSCQNIPDVNNVHLSLCSKTLNIKCTVKFVYIEDSIKQTSCFFDMNL